MEWSRFVFFISFIFLLFFLSVSFYRNTCHGCGSPACSRRQLILRSLELCEIPSTWNWTITKLTQATPIKGDTQLSNIYFIIIYFYYMSDLPVLFYFGPTYTETYCRLIWGKEKYTCEPGHCHHPIWCYAHWAYIDHVQWVGLLSVIHWPTFAGHAKTITKQLVFPPSLWVHWYSRYKH